MNWEIRTALAEECVEIAALVNSAYRGDSSRRGWTTEADLLGGQRTDSDAIRELLVSRHKTFLVIPGQERPLAGCVLLECRSPEIAYLGMLTVDPLLQAQGLGKVLLEKGEEFARSEWRSKMMEMTVITRRTELLKWYERRGYRRTGEKRPFPAADPRFGVPLLELEFEVLRKDLG